MIYTKLDLSVTRIDEDLNEAGIVDPGNRSTVAGISNVIFLISYIISDDCDFHLPQFKTASKIGISLRTSASGRWISRL